MFYWLFLLVKTYVISKHYMLEKILVIFRSETKEYYLKKCDGGPVISLYLRNDSNVGDKGANYSVSTCVSHAHDSGYVQD